MYHGLFVISLSILVEFVRLSADLKEDGVLMNRVEISSRSVSIYMCDLCPKRLLWQRPSERWSLYGQ